MISLMFKNWFEKRIFLDYASATPVDWCVDLEMWKYHSHNFYNPNAIYAEGEKVKEKVEEYRAKIARMLGVSPSSIIFTSGGTEANVLAVRGVGPGQVEVREGSHPSVAEAVRESKSKKLVLVSSPTTDNKLGRTIREERKKKNSEYPLLHIDVSQSALYFDVGLEKLACDLLTLDAAKLYGPKGIGALVVRKGVKIDIPPRGTPPVPLIAGFTKALELAVRDREREKERLLSLSTHFVNEIEKNLPQAEVSVTEPNMVNVTIAGILPEFLVLALDKEGVMASAGPACESHKPEPPETPVRFSLGRQTTKKDIDRAVEILCRVIENMVKSGHATIQSLHHQSQGSH